MRRILLVLIASLALQLCAGLYAPASAEPKAASQSDMATIRAAAVLVRAKKPDAALAKLDPLADRLSGNPDFDYVYGVAAFEAGHPAQAAVALRRAIAARPNFHLARAELGRALAAMGDLSGAKREFEFVRDAKEVPAAARDAMGRQIIVLDESASSVRTPVQEARPANPRAGEPRTKVSGYIENSLGYDTNVNAGPSAESLIIPALAFLGPAALSPNAMPKKAGFYEIAGAVNVTHTIDDTTAVFANLIGNWHPLFANEDFRTALIGGEAGIAREVPGVGIFSVEGLGQSFFMGDSAFRNLYGAATQWRQRYADNWDVSLAFSWLGLEYPTMFGQDADRYSVIGTLAHKWEQLPLMPAFSVTATAGKEIARGDGMNFLSFTLLGARVGLETTWTPWLLAFLQASYEDHHYDADYPLFFMHRHDGIIDLLAGVEIKLAEHVTLRPSVHYSEVRSNVDLFDQKRWISTLTLRTGF